MTRYAETDDIESGWRSLSPTERHWAEQLLDAAGAWISIKTDPATLDPDMASFVSVDVVRGALAPGTQLGMASFSKTIGPWSKSGTLVNPLGHLDFTKLHKELLGLLTTSGPLWHFQENDY